MPAEITMPQLSDTMSEGTLVKWLKKEGDKVKEGDAVAEVETDKAVMPMEVFEGGTLAAVLVQEGEKVKVGAVIGLIARSGEDAAAIKKQGAGAPAKAAEAKPAAKAEAGKEVPAAPAATATAIAEAPAPAKAASENGERIRISPLAKRVAAEKGFDPAQIKGTGPNGRIHVADVENFKPAAAAPAAAEEKKTPALAAVKTSGSKEVIALTKMRQTIAQRLQFSKQNIPHFQVSVDIDMGAALELREKLNKQLEKEKIKLTVNDLVMKATAVALQRNPAVNAHFKDKEAEIHRFADVNLGIAVALPDGLIVPVLRGVQNMGLKEIKVRTADLVDRARQQKLKGDEMSGGTFTISNLGAWGVSSFTAIVNPPEVGILAVAAATEKPVIVNGQVVARPMMTVTLSGDHRAIDGAVGAEFCRSLKMLLEEPGLMLV